MTVCAAAGSCIAYAAENISAAEDKQAYASSPVVLTVKDSNTGRVKKTYSIQDIIDLGIEESYPITSGNSSKMVFQKVSARSDAKQSTWYGAMGVTVEWILRDLGIWDTCETVTFMSTDSTVRALTKAQVQSPEGYYFADTSDKQGKVYPMIAFWYSESEKNNYVDPVRPEINAALLNEEAPRLFIGQSEYNEVNSGNMLKKIETIYAEFPADDLYNVPPVIKGVPDGPIYLQKGQQYNEPSGIYAQDAYGQTVKVERSVRNEDGSLNYIDTNIPGIYTVTYSAADKRGNTASKELKVYVQESEAQKGSYALSIQGLNGCVSSDESSNELNVPEKYNGKASFSVTVTPEKRYGNSQNVIFLHYRGDKLINVSSQILSLNAARSLNGSFTVNGGDCIRVFVTDAFDSKKGKGSFIFNRMNTSH